jgi:tight adherence protein C
VPAPVVIGSAAVSGACLSLWWAVAGDRRVRVKASRNLRAGLSPSTDLREHLLAEPASERAVKPLTERVVAAVRRLTPAGAADKVNRRIAMAGMAAKWSVDRTLAARVLFGGFGLFLSFLLVPTGNKIAVFYGFMLPPTLFFGPDIILRNKAKERQKKIRLALPDTLDQITVCVEAGLGFEGAMARAAKTGEGPLAEELVRTLQDVQLGVPRKEAMRSLAERNDVDELGHFVSTIVQAEGYGVPIARVLRIHANELRDKRRQDAEERAMKISIKMLFPLVTCILPATFIVIVAPAIFELMKTLGSGPG